MPEQHKILLDESEMPTRWYNIVPDLPEPPPPPLHPATRQPVGPDDLAPLFPPELIAQMAPNWHFLHVVQDVVPELLRRGVTQEQVDLMLRGNPRAFFERS